MIEAALFMLEKTINQALSTDLQTIARLQELSGKKIKWVISDWNLSFFVIPKQDGVELRPSLAGEPDTVISGTLPHLLQVAVTRDKTEAMKKYHLQFSGDAHTGIALQQIFAHLHIDWEAHLSCIVGDIPATFIGKAVRKTTAFGKQVLHSLKRNTQEYIHYEARLSPTRDELEVFYKEITRLRDDVDRLDAKLTIEKNKNAY